MVALNLFAARKNSSIGSWASTQRIFCGISGSCFLRGEETAVVVVYAGGVASGRASTLAGACAKQREAASPCPLFSIRIAPPG